MGSAATIGQTQALFTADTKTFDANVKMSAEQLKLVGTAAQQAGNQVAQAGEKIDRSAQLVARAKEKEAAAQDKYRRAVQQALNERMVQEEMKAAKAAFDAANAQEKLAGAVGHSVPQFAAASGAIRVLEGGMNNNVRAAERFLSTTLGLGPVLSAAFPVVGAIAMIGVVSELVKKVYDFGNNAAVLGRELGAGWLDGAVAQVDGLAKTVAQADEQILELHKDMDGLRERGSSLDLEYLRMTQGPAAADRAEAGQRQGYIRAQQAMLTLLQQGRSALQERSTVQAYWATDPKSGVRTYVDQPTQDNLAAQKLLQVTDAQIRDVQMHVDEAQRQARNLNTQADQADAAARQKAANDGARGAFVQMRDAGRSREQIWKNLNGGPLAPQFRQSLREQAKQANFADAPPLGWNQGGGHDKELDAAQTQAREIVAQNAHAFDEERDKIAVATGALSMHEAALRKSADDVQDYREKIAALAQELSELKKDDGFYAGLGQENPNAAAQQRVQNEITRTVGARDQAQLQNDQLVRSTTALGTFSISLGRLSQEFTNTGEQLSGVFVEGLRTFNQTLIEVLSTPANMLRGKHVWGNAGASFFKSVGGTALQHAEGAGMGLLSKIPGPFGKFFQGAHKPTGSQGDPLYVRSADGGAGSAAGLFGSGGAAGVFGTSSTSGAGGSLINMGAGAAASGIAAWIAGMGAAGAVSSFGAGGVAGAFADGGAIPSNLPALVGERGPEIFMPRTAGTIIPNHKLGGGDVHVHVDARGATDPAAIRAGVHRAMMAYVPHLKGMSRSSVADHNRRVPSSGRV